MHRKHGKFQSLESFYPQISQMDTDFLTAVAFGEGWFQVLETQSPEPKFCPLYSLRNLDPDFPFPFFKESLDGLALCFVEQVGVGKTFFFCILRKRYDFLSFEVG